MNWRALAFLTGLTITLVAPVSGQPADADEAAIRDTIQAYFKGDLDRDVESLKKAFHPTAVLMTVGEGGALAVLTQPDWHARVRQTPDRERPTPQVLQIDRAGNAAMAKTRLTFPHGAFTDFLSLLKIQGKWTVVNKTYHWEDAPASK
jgi:hypothetical protein